MLRCKYYPRQLFVFLYLAFVFAGCGTPSESSSSIRGFSNVEGQDQSDLRNGEVDASFVGRDGNYIVPGYGTRGIHLGRTREELIRILGLPSEEFDHRDECEFTEMHWLTKAGQDGRMEPGDGVFAYLQDGKVFQLSFSNPKYVTEGGNKFGESAEHLRKTDGLLLKSYILTNSASTASNYNDLFYEVDQENGIAFQLALPAKRTANEKSVWDINVFRQNTAFIPLGCIGSNRAFDPATP